MKRYTCECPVCGTINKDLYLEDSQGWYVCEKCDTSVQAMEVVKRVCFLHCNHPPFSLTTNRTTDLNLIARLGTPMHKA